jgi:hypothetical protein
VILAWLVACSSCVGLPDSVPAGAGKITEADGPDLLTATSPDLSVLPWLTLAQLSTEDFRDCPLVYIQDSVISADAGVPDGCLDSAGVQWRGSAAVTRGAEDALVFSFEDFGPVEGVPAPWSAFGTLILSVTDSGAGQRLVSRLELTSMGPEEERVYWSETMASYAAYDRVYYVDHAYGSVGVMDWGTTDIDINRVPLSLVNGCGYGLHAGGTTAMFAKNKAVLFFSEGESVAAPPPYDTSGGIDTGPTGSSGGSGSGGSGGDGAIEIPNPMASGVGPCGECVGLTVDGEAIAGCVEPARSMSWPFYAPF